MLKLSFAGASISEVHASVLAYAATLGAAPAVVVVDHGPGPSTIIPPAPALDPAPAAAAAPASENSGKRDAAGTLFDPARHTGTIVKSGLWRMKAGLARGPGEGEDAIPAAGASAAAGAIPAAPALAPVEEDEFAAFRAAASQAAPAAAVAPARSWTDADLSALCNQAAMATGNPEPIKAIIARYVPEGQQQHSRMVPDTHRELFAKEIEAAFGIQYGA